MRSDSTDIPTGGDEFGKIVQPVALADSRGVDHVREIVFCVGEDKGGVAHLKSSTGGHASCCGRDFRGNLRRIDYGLRARETLSKLSSQARNTLGVL